MMKMLKQYNLGFTLIEVLIAVVILSIGLLGMAGIQIKGLRGTTSSTVRSQATMLANDIAERIHVNANGVFVQNAAVNQHYANVNTAAIDCTNPPTFCSVTPGSNAVTPCATAGTMATFDIFDFACGLSGNAGVKNLLPTGNATISCNDVANSCPPGSQLTININWSELDPNNGGQSNKTVTMVIVP